MGKLESDVGVVGKERLDRGVPSFLIQRCSHFFLQGQTFLFATVDQSIPQQCAAACML